MNLSPPFPPPPFNVRQSERENVMRIAESRWRHFRHGAQKLVLPTWETLDPETKHICQQFLTYHMDKAMHDLVRDRRYHSLTQIHLSNVSLHAEY